MYDIRIFITMILDFSLNFKPWIALTAISVFIAEPNFHTSGVI